jgi:tetratricopeptide (TPR) repeat protein
MAALVSMPILVAILYRFWSSLPFIAVVGFLGVMPWLAITLLASCILASVRPFRTRFRFMSALIALVPVIVYLGLAWNGTREVMVGRVDPADAFKFVAPWVLAIVASAAVFAVVLSIAKLVNYRPGAVTPLLAVMFALPVALFEQHVGRDELYYRLLEKLDAAWFAEVNTSVDWMDAAQGVWAGFPLPQSAAESSGQRAEEKWLLELTADVGPYRTDLTQHQLAIAARCDWFLRNFPDSRYAVNALYLKARALDRRIDREDFRRSRWIRYYDGFPSQWSEEEWRMIYANRPGSPLGAAAGLRAAQLDARKGDILPAVSRLKEVLDRFERGAATAAFPPTAAAAIQADPLAGEPPEASLRIPLDQIVVEARRLHDLLEYNNDPRYAYGPIRGPKRGAGPLWFGMLDVNPRGGYYAERLEEIVARYPGCQVEDNIELEIAKLADDPAKRIDRLTALLDRFPTGDAAAEALLYLGQAYEAAGRPQEALDAFARLGVAHPSSYWARVLARLSNLGGDAARGKGGR